jgi:hypothetical protein
MNASIMDKTSLLITDLIPKNQESISKNIESNFMQLNALLVTETTKLLNSSTDKNTIEMLINNVNQLITQSHGTLATLFTNTDTKIEQIQSRMSETHADSKTLNGKVCDIIKVFDSVQGKANVSEIAVFNVLTQLYPSAEITHVGQTKETGDIMFSQFNKPQILIENKNHETKNVPKMDVDKFIRDCQIQK